MLRTIVREDDELGRWGMVLRPPGGPLAGLASPVRGYAQAVTTPGTHTTAATARLPLVIPFGHRHEVTGADGTVVRVGAFVAGSHEAVGEVTASGFHGIQVDLAPIAAHRIVGGGVADLAGHVVALDDVLGPEGRRLVERLGELDDWGERLDLVAATLVARWERGPLPDPEVAEVWRRLAVGATRVDELAAGLGWSTRQLRRRVTAQLGLPPKRLARLVRFERGVARLECDRRTPLARLAVEQGWYDQAHMANDFRELAGRSPRTVRDRRADLSVSSKPGPSPGS